VTSDAVNTGMAAQTEGHPLVLLHKSPPSASCWGGLVGWLVTWSKNHQEHTSVKNCHPWSWTWDRCQDGLLCRSVAVCVLLVYDIEKYFSLQKFVLYTWWISVFASYWRCNHIEYKKRHTENDAWLVNLQCSLKMIVCKYL